MVRLLMGIYVMHTPLWTRLIFSNCPFRLEAAFNSLGKIPSFVLIIHETDEFGAAIT